MFKRILVGVLLIAALFSTLQTVQSYPANQILSSDLHLIADSSDPPTVEWSDVGILADGIYAGQTEEVFDFDIWVNDTDGVDTVIFRFYYRSEWLNRTTTITEGDEIRGRYSGSLVCSVSWDWISGRPSPAGHGFQFKVFANDTLGNWNETTAALYSYGYYVIMPPIHYILLATPLGWAIIGGSICIIGLFIRRRRRAKPSQDAIV